MLASLAFWTATIDAESELGTLGYSQNPGINRELSCGHIHFSVSFPGSLRYQGNPLIQRFYSDIVHPTRNHSEGARRCGRQIDHSRLYSGASIGNGDDDRLLVSQ